MRVNVFYTERATTRQTPQHRTADGDDRRAQRHSFEHVDSTPDATVEDHWHASFDHIDRRLQQADRTRNAIDLSTAVVRNPDAGRPGRKAFPNILWMNDALGDDG